MFLSQSGKVYVLDKTENNPVTVSGKYGTHPAWAVEYDPDANSCKRLTRDRRPPLTHQTEQWTSTRTRSAPVVACWGTERGWFSAGISVSWIFLKQLDDHLPSAVR
jgi:glucose dehydrogenase